MPQTFTQLPMRPTNPLHLRPSPKSRFKLIELQIIPRQRRQICRRTRIRPDDTFQLLGYNFVQFIEYVKVWVLMCWFDAD